MTDAALKRGLDLLVASVALVALAPLMVGSAALVLVTMGRPVLFSQARAGRGGRIFHVRKFRTMRPGAASDADRLTASGQWLRSASLDELPQLWNVLVGDMSLVGPRPLLPEYLERYSPHQARRHEVRPGITGLAQVRGRNSISWQERLALDVEYVDTRSMRFDIALLVETVRVVLRRSGVEGSANGAMPEFLGDEEPTPSS